MVQRRFSLFIILALVSLLASALPAVAQAQSDSPVDIVDVTGGQVQGVPSDVEGVQVFKGIPFSGPNGGENRWKPPQPVVPWDGVMVADTWGDQVLQPLDLNPIGSFYGDEFYYDPEYMPPATENGLFLNVWTPAQSVSDNLPVFVYIHGGGNNHGFASEIEFVASELAAKGIVVVTVSYRVGAFGFMAHPELSAESPDGISGNYAILDLIQSLEWVQENIAGFGGDPATVTIGGQSAGAINSASLMRSPLAQGLFQRVVLESGFSGFFPWGAFPTLAEKETAAVEAIPQIFGEEMTIEDLRAIPGEDFITEMAADGEATLFWALNGAMGGLALDDVVFTEDSIDLMAPGALDGYDVMLGGTATEYSSLTGSPETTMTLDEFSAQTQELLGYPADQTAYRPDSELAAYRMFLKARGDQVFQTYLLSSQLAQANNQDLDVYAYYFDQATPGRDEDYYGAWHSADLWYWFDSMRDNEGQRYWTSADYRLADTMSSYLANFVKAGDPNEAGLPAWDEVTTETAAFVRFADGYAYPVTETPYPDRDALNRSSVMTSRDISEADLGSAAPAEAATTTYSRIDEVMDWGAATTKLIVNLGAEVSQGTVDPMSFSVFVTRSDPRLAEPLLEEGERTVLDAYISDAEGSPADTGSFATLVMEIGPQLSLSSALNYGMDPAAQRNFNAWTQNDYVITQEKAIGVIDGGLVATEMDQYWRPLLDEFELGATTYEDAEYGSIELTYAHYAPAADDATHPLIVWLHGGGEGGTDATIPLAANKAPALVSEDVQAYFGGAYVLVPQAPTRWMDTGLSTDRRMGVESIFTRAVQDLVENYVAENPGIDVNRIYLGGLSNGGYLTIRLILDNPDYYAAAIAVAEPFVGDSASDAQLSKIVDLPIWFVTAATDQTVPADQYPLNLYNRLQQLGASNVYMSYLPRVLDETGLYTDEDGAPYEYNGHWSWIYFYNNELAQVLVGDAVGSQIFGQAVHQAADSDNVMTILAWLAAQSKD
ncbi:MAG: carboxylesterase family protein [Caldilineaceae bacterium]|nr:carboxylesterase family protein [Caldilineaceae bacterium]